MPLLLAISLERGTVSLEPVEVTDDMKALMSSSEGRYELLVALPTFPPVVFVSTPEFALDTEADTLAIKDPNDSRKELLPVALSLIDAGSVASEIDAFEVTDDMKALMSSSEGRYELLVALPTSHPVIDAGSVALEFDVPDTIDISELR